MGVKQVLKVFAGGAVASLFVALAPSQAQVRASINQSFESPTYAEAIANGQVSTDFSNSVRNIWAGPDTSVPGWGSTHSPTCFGEPCIEIWADGNAQDGDQHIELDAFEPSAALLENVCLINGETLSWSFWHRNRTGGADEVRFQIGNGLQVLANQNTTSTTVWSQNANSATVALPTGTYDLQFVSILPGSGSNGNFLDNISITLTPLIEFDLAGFSDFEGGSNVPQLRISGTVEGAGITVPITVTGGTASSGEYTVPSSVFIPPGVYPDTLIDIPITLNQDTDIEGNETFDIQISSGAGYIIARTDCTTGSAQTSATYTILDEDARLTLNKTIVNTGSGPISDPATWTLAFNDNDDDTASGTSGEASVSTANITSGTFDLSESGGPVTYSLSNLSCSGAADTSASVANPQVDILPGEIVTCTFTNTYAPTFSYDVVKSYVSGPTTVLGANTAISDAGDTISFSVNVSNTGNEILSNMNVSEALVGAIVECATSGDATIASLGVGLSEVCAITYPLTQVDFDTDGGGDGDIDNTVSVEVTTGFGNLSESDDAVASISQISQLNIVKTASTAGPVNAGDTITYTFAVTNLGNVTVSGIDVVDISDGDPDPVPEDEVLSTVGGVAVSATTTDAAQNGVWDALGPGDSIEFTADYLVTQIDVDTLQ